MKITKRQLKQIIREELAALQEDEHIRPGGNAELENSPARGTGPGKAGAGAYPTTVGLEEGKITNRTLRRLVETVVLNTLKD